MCVIWRSDSVLCLRFVGVYGHATGHGKVKKGFFPACWSAWFDQLSASATLCPIWCVCLLFQPALAAKRFSSQTLLSLRGLFQTIFQTITIFIFFIFSPSWQSRWFHTHSYHLWKRYFDSDRFKVKSRTKWALLFLNITRFSAVSSNLNQIYIIYRPKCNEEITMVTWNIA